MGIAAEFDTWLVALLKNYIGNNTKALAESLEPTVVLLSILYVMVYGYLLLVGQLQAPFLEGVKRMALIAGIMLVGLKGWFYGTVIVELFFQAPTEVAAAIIHAPEPVTIVDTILFQGGDAAQLLMAKGAWFSGDITFKLMGLFVYACTGIVAIYVLFLMELSRIALSVLLSLGPLFLCFLFFNSTRRLCEAWIAQLATFGFTIILVVLVSSLMLTLVTKAAAQAVAAGGDITVADGVRVGLASGLTLLILRQVTPIASALGNGVALATGGVLSSALARVGHAGAQAGRGLFDTVSLRRDPLSRQLGAVVGRGIRATAGGAYRGTRRLIVGPNAIKAAPSSVKSGGGQ